MLDISIEKINEAFEKVPEELNRAMSTVDISRTLLDIQKKYNLHIDKIGEIESNLNYLFLNLIKQEDFNQELRNIIPEHLDEVTKDLNEKIINPIKEKFLKLLETDKDAKQKTEAELLEEESKEQKPQTEENKEKLAEKKDILEEKMLGQFSLPKKETDYSINKDSEEKRVDPYREQI